MNKAEINALEARYKAMALLLLDQGLMKGRIDQLMEYGHMAFDSGKYRICVKALDLVSIEVVNILEFQPNLN